MWMLESGLIGLRLRAYILGSKAQGLRFRVKGLGFRVEG
jgi:hypothetical protein